MYTLLETNSLAHFRHKTDFKSTCIKTINSFWFFQGSFGHDRPPSSLENNHSHFLAGPQTPSQTYQTSHPQSEWENIFFKNNVTTIFCCQLSIVESAQLLSGSFSRTQSFYLLWLVRFMKGMIIREETLRMS